MASFPSYTFKLTAKAQTTNMSCLIHEVWDFFSIGFNDSVDLEYQKQKVNSE